MHLIDRIGPILGSIKFVDRFGPILGIVAFVGLVVLAFLLFQEAREVRRLREWAGRAPERAAEATEAQLAVAEARQQGVSGPPPSRWQRLRGRAAAARQRLATGLTAQRRALDRRLPVDARIVVAAVVAAVAGLVAAGVVTSGFGFIGSTSEGGRTRAARPPSNLRIAVLNGTEQAGVQAVAGLASKVAHRVVKPAGYRAGPVTNAPGSFATTVVMFKPGHRGDARALATTVRPKLGKTRTQSMTGATQSVARKAQLALVIGLDDSRFGQSTG
jgi:LytR cell envelope-related transcriptional attenuator